MYKKVYLFVVLVCFAASIYSNDYPGFHWGLSLGLHFNNQELVSDESTIDSQVDSITLFMINVKFGGLLKVGYYFNPLFAVGLESGIIFNSYQASGPFRGFIKIGLADFNFNILGGVSVNREVSPIGDGVNDVVLGGTIELGGRIEIMHLYFEWLNSTSLNNILPNSTKISFGYTLFLPDL